MSKNKSKKVIRGPPLEDRVGKYYPACTNPRHIGIVRYSFYKVCEKRDCKYYTKYRSGKNVQ